ncbi:MAG: nucleotidyltransferase domain-containing protein [Eubacterium sp.]|nr:nucleotidyltransferase domain-containing protein [Eubacterium sp.]
MLYGNELIQERIQQEIAYCEKTRGIKVIYGANVGGISKGLQYKDSDYDTRFLYINKDFPKKIFIPENIAEKEIIYRKYYDGTPFEWLPFWEFSSFIQFLINPSIDHKFSTGLYNVVGWTFLSPYNYDPYGIQAKILPLIQKIFHKDYCIAYHRDLLESFSLDGDIIVAKDYMYALHAALTINWIEKYNEYPPIYMHTLLADEPSIYPEVCKIIKCYQNEAAEFVDKSTHRKLHDTHFKIMTKHIHVVDEYLEKTQRKLEMFRVREITEEQVAEYKIIIKEIYSIVEYAIDSEENVNGVN